MLGCVGVTVYFVLQYQKQSNVPHSNVVLPGRIVGTPVPINSVPEVAIIKPSNTPPPALNFMPWLSHGLW